MIRFRIGQSWKREAAAPPVDSFGLELDGVDLLPEASEEPLQQVVPALVETVHALAGEGEPVAQLSLGEAHLELVFRRVDGDIEVQVVSLSRPARVQRAGVRVDLKELSEAAVKCGRSLVRDLAEAGRPGPDDAWHRKLLQRLDSLEGAEPAAIRRDHRQTGFSFHFAAPMPGAFGFQLSDPDDLLLAFDRKGHGALGSLLCGGECFVKVADGGWRAKAVPFLFALELSRQALELSHAIELKERTFTFRPGGIDPELRLDLDRGELDSGQARVPVVPEAVLRSMFELGVSLGFAITSRNKQQAKNPYLEELLARCREGLSHLRPPLTASDAERPRKASRKQATSRPLKTAGRLRRLRFEPLWEKQNLGGGGDEAGRLLLGLRGPVFSSEAMAIGLSPRGEILFRRVATRGVAASRDGRVICAFEDRVMGFQGSETSARWCHDHDGLPIGPDLLRREGLWITTSEGRAALAFHEVTGREIWRAAPPRTQRAYLAVQSHRALLATDSGYLFGLDLGDGQIRYRMRAALPFLGPPLPWGRKMVASLGRGDRYAVFAADAHAGKLQQEHEFTLRLPSAPLALGNRLYLAGEQDDDGVLLCFGAQGKLAFQRKLHLGRGPYELLRVDRAVLAVGATGAATLVAGDGQVQWHAGASGEPLATRPPPAYARGVVLLPGETVRAVDPRGGQLLAEVNAGAGLCDLKVDGRLNLYLLDDAGTLKAYRLATHLAVV
jgi:outer membrane protein assembly factor BamB